MPSAGETAVTDLEWLEPPHDPQALAWSRAQTEASTTALRALPHFADVYEALKGVNLKAGEMAPIALRGRRAIRLHRDASHPKGVLQAAVWDGTRVGSWESVLDVADLSKAEGVDLMLQWSATHLGPDGDRCLLHLHPDGGDECTIREFDLATVRFVPGGFALPSSRCMAAWIDADTVLVGHSLDGAPRTVTGWPAQALVWRRGTPVAEAKAVLQLAPEHALFLPVPAGARGRVVIAQAIDYSHFRLHVVESTGSIRDLDVPLSLKMAFGANATHVFAQLSEPASVQGQQIAADSVVAAPLQLDAGPVEMVWHARPDETVDSDFNFSATADALALPVRSGLATRIDLARRMHDGWQVGSWVGTRTGVHADVVCADGKDGFVVMSSGFLQAPAQHWMHCDSGGVLLESHEPSFDTSALSVDCLRATSRDGQAIEFFIVGPVRRDGPIATLMTGYGAFGISMTPAYFNAGSRGQVLGGATLKLWFERGGALVIPALRGGGEHGAAWHRAAMREQRQRSYDDFHAVAEALIGSGYTTPSQLGVFGLSNGGLLAAVAGTQRPDLYGAIVSDVPLTDMLRFPTMGMGAAWTDEYGDPADPAAAAWLAAYSPVHNVRPGVDYPAFLVTVATTDNRVGPGHARKLAKRLLDVNANALFLEPEHGGHGVSDPLQQPDVMAMRATFFIHHLMSAPAAHRTS